jgi:8-oxo-dGTP diphosphatase
MANQPVDITALVRANIRAARARLNLTQASVARRMQQLGYSWYPQTVGLVERNQRPLLADELAALAMCFETTFDVLALPPFDVAQVAFGEHVIPAQRLSIIDDSVTWDGDTLKVSQPSVRYRPGDTRRTIDVMREELASREAGAEQAQPIVAAIVTSPLGVLVGRRMDGKPPWTFIAGEVEPGELPADAAVREVKEETTLRVRAGEVIGERVHPKSQRHMIYMAAAPTHGTDVFVGDEEELAEVRWVSLAEADQLMGGMIFEPVHEYLARELRGQGDDQR